MFHSKLSARGALAGAAAIVALGLASGLPGPAAAQPAGAYAPDSNYQDCEQHKTGATVAGAVIGGVLGAVIGSNVAERGDRGGGSVIGGAAGAVAGGAIGNSTANCDTLPPPNYDERGDGRDYSDNYGPPPPPAPYGDEGYGPPPAPYPDQGYGPDQGPPPDAYDREYDQSAPPPPPPDGPGYPGAGPYDRGYQYGPDPR